MVISTFVLVVAGALVTSRDAGLAVPDWPLSFGTLNPPRWYAIENVRTEHGHRLVAGCVALLTGVLALRVRRLRPRPAVRRLAYAAFAAVLLQALLGGLRVLNLSLDLAMVHGWLAQVFLSIVVSLAVVTSPHWREPHREPAGPLPVVAVATSLLVICQLVVGIVVRHTVVGTGPLSAHPVFYAHVAGAILIVLAAVWLSSFAGAESIPQHLSMRIRGLLSLVLVQVVLGIAAWIATQGRASDRSPSFVESWVPTLHVGVGAGVLALSVTISLYTFGRARAAERLQARAAGVVR